MKALLISDIQGGIGKDGTIPFNFPEDRKFFKETTMDKCVVMGYNTWLDPEMPKPLKGRTNIVLTSKNFGNDSYKSTYFIKNKLDLKDLLIELNVKSDDVYVIGGEKTIMSLIDDIDELIIVLDPYHDYYCDVVFDIPKGYELDLSYSLEGENNLEVLHYKKTPKVNEEKIEKNDETASRPTHYSSNEFGIECRFVFPYIDANLSNVLKYVWRLGFKDNNNKEINKALTYLSFFNELDSTFIKFTSNDYVYRVHKKGAYDIFLSIIKSKIKEDSPDIMEKKYQIVKNILKLDLFNNCQSEDERKLYTSRIEESLKSMLI